jgi:uncharacterized protein YbaP (TraB family)
MRFQLKKSHLGKTISSALLVSLMSFYGTTALAQKQTNTATSPSAATAVATIEAPTKGLLFEIKSGKNVSYLFGSIHIAKADFYPMSPKVEAAYAQADTLVVEADASDQAEAMKHMPKLMFTAPDKLENHLKPETWTLVKSMIGPQAEQLQSYKPAMVAMSMAMNIASAQGYLPTYGIDVHYLTKAKADKKNLVELESMAFQFNMLNSLSDEEGDAMVASTFNSFKDGSFFKDLNALVNIWKSSDAKAMSSLLLESANQDEGSKKLHVKMFDDRNEGMAMKIKAMMEQGKKTFIVVGAGHLAGDKSIVDLLQKQGLQVTQIK